MPNISASGETSSYLADATKFPGNSYDDKGNGNELIILLCSCNLIILFQCLTCGI